ncbi:MAG TPA: hypothetical protein VF114_01840, partial [Candidatus Limnocylindria bacterium]
VGRRDTAINHDVPEEGLVVPPDAHEVGRWPPRIGVVMQARLGCDRFWTAKSVSLRMARSQAISDRIAAAESTARP